MQRRIHHAAVDEHQQFVGAGIVESARGNGPPMRVDLRYVKIRRQPQRFGQARRARATDIVPRDDLNGRRGIRQFFRTLGDRRHLDRLQLVEA